MTSNLSPVTNELLLAASDLLGRAANPLLHTRSACDDPGLLLEDMDDLVVYLGEAVSEALEEYGLDIDTASLATARLMLHRCMYRI